MKDGIYNLALQKIELRSEIRKLRQSETKLVNEIDLLEGERDYNLTLEGTDPKEAEIMRS